MDAAGVLAGGEERVDGRATGSVDDDAAHHEVRGRKDLDRTAREIAAEVATAPHHAAKVALDGIGAEVGDVDPHAAVRRAAALAHLEKRGARDQVPRRALHPLGVVARHEPLTLAIAQLPAGAAQAFLEQRARHERAGNDEPGRMELDHFHVAQWQPRTVRERDAVGSLVGRARDDLVHRRPTAHRKQRGSRANGEEVAGAEIEHERAGRATGVVEQHLDRPALLERADRGACERLLGQPVHDLDAGEVALVHGAVVALAGEWLLMNASRRRAIEQAAVPGLELQHAGGRLRHQRPHELLVVDEAAASQRVAQMRLERVGLGQHGVVAALHHSSAARAAEESLHDNRDRQRRIGVGGVQRGAKTGAARAEDEDVGVEDLDHRASSASMTARPSGSVHGRVPTARAATRPSRSTRNAEGVAVIAQSREATPDGSSPTTIVMRLLRTHAATASAGSSMFTATTASPRPLYSRCSCSMVEGNSLAQYGHQVAQKYKSTGRPRSSRSVSVRPPSRRATARGGGVVVMGAFNRRPPSSSRARPSAAAATELTSSTMIAVAPSHARMAGMLLRI